MNRPVVIVLSLLLCIGGIAACGSDDETAAPVDTTTTLVISAADGAVVPAASVDELVGKLSGAPSQEASLDPEVAKALITVQLRAAGLTDAEAACVASKAPAAAAGSSTTRPATAAGAAGGPSGLDPAAISGCVAISRMAQLATAAPNLSKVPPADLRQVLTMISLATLKAAGFTPDESTCVLDKGLADVTDDQLTQLLTGAVPAPQMRTGIAACLPAERVRDLAAK